MASQEDQNVYGEEDVDEDDDDESEEEDQDLTLPNEDDEVDDEDDSMSSAAGEVTIAVAGIPNGDLTATTNTATTPIPLPDPTKADDVMIPTTVVEEKKPMPMPLDESRRLFQRLWTDEDEIELLQGFLDYTTQRGTHNNSSSHHHHDTTAFYDQIKSKLQLDFNKNQLVEKLRRLKKKYRNVLSKISSGKEVVFKSPHDQATFEISCKIWNTATGGSNTMAEDDDDANPNPTPTPNRSLNLNDHSYNGGGADPNSSEKKAPRSRKRSRGVGGGVKIEEKSRLPFIQPCDQSGASIPNLVEETVKSCLLPLFKEVLNNAMNVPSGPRGLGAMNLNTLPMSFGGSMNFTGAGDISDEKWRKQHILELEVYSKRLELLQDQVKSQLEELKSMGS